MATLTVGEGQDFATIQAAIDASASGDTIDIAAGTYGGTLSISHGLTFLGHGAATIQVDAAVGAAIELSGTALAGQTVTFDGLTIDGGDSDKIGIRTIAGSDVGGLVLNDVELRGFVDYGVLTNPGTLDGVTISGSLFEDNGASTVSGAAHIHLWGFSGDALIEDVTITGAEGVPVGGSNGTNPEYGLQFTGIINDDIASQPGPAMGDVTIDGLVVTGSFGKNAFAVGTFGDQVQRFSLLTPRGELLECDRERNADVFHAAIAGAPVTEWRLYDTHYTERYLGDPASQPEVYDANSLLPLAPLLSRPLLLVHGLADDNVVAAHTLQLSSALLAAGRPHEVLPLVGVTHMTPQEVVAENLLLHQLDFLRRSLGVPR